MGKAALEHSDYVIFTSDNPVVLYNEKLKSYKIEDNYITDSNNFIFFPISTQLFLMILPSNNTKLVDFGEYVDCIIDGTKEIIDFQNFGFRRRDKYLYKRGNSTLPYKRVLNGNMRHWNMTTKA